MKASRMATGSMNRIELCYCVPRTYEHMASLGPGEVNTMLAVLSGTVLDGGEGATQTQVKGSGGGFTRY